MTPETFWSLVDKTDGGCWIFRGTLNGNGYGVARIGRVRMAHRFAYEATRGPIPSGLTIDHLCRVRACVNPDHLDAVTPRENILRGENVAARHARQTHCKNGHELSPENVRRLTGTMRRDCRTCHRARMRRYAGRRMERAA